LLKKSAKGRFKYPDGPKVAAELVRSPVAVRARPRKSPVGAIVRGIFIGGFFLALGVGAFEVQKRGGIEAVKGWIAKLSAQTKTAPAKSKPIEANPAINPELAVAIAPAPAPAATAPSASQKPTTLSQSSPVTPPAPAPAGTAAPVPAPAADPTMTASAPPTAALPANVSLFDTTPPPASPPAADPTAPATAPAATAPAAPQRIYAKITKPTVINLRFGSSTLRPGTPVQVLSASGANLTIQFGPETHTIPAANTDYAGSSLPPATSQ
jgi:hypothetical protein